MSAPRSPRRSSPIALGALMVVTTLTLAACSGDDDDDMDAVDAADQTSMPAPGTDPNAPPDLTPVSYLVPLTVEQEIPVPTGQPIALDDAAGEANLTFDPATNGITGTITTSGLSGLPTMAHIHEEDVPGDGTGPVIHAFVPGVEPGSFELPGDTLLSEEEAESLETGTLYVNVHTDQNPAGEIRGQIVLADPEGADVGATR